MQDEDKIIPPVIHISVCDTVQVRVQDEAQVWAAASFASEWFADALKEAREGQDRNSRRREIVFAVCFMESYLFEWVRDKLGGVGFDTLTQFFPAGDRRGICDGWIKVLKALHDKKLIRAVPSFTGSSWPKFVKLVKYRDDLVQASASRPEIVAPSTTQRHSPRPVPSPTDLDHLAAGWAVRAVVTTIRELHQAVGTNPPEWLCEP
jgi:hypothetical protein